MSTKTQRTHQRKRGCAKRSAENSEHITAKYWRSSGEPRKGNSERQTKAEAERNGFRVKVRVIQAQSEGPPKMVSKKSDTRPPALHVLALLRRQKRKKGKQNKSLFLPLGFPETLNHSLERPGYPFLEKFLNSKPESVSVELVLSNRKFFNLVATFGQLWQVAATSTEGINPMTLAIGSQSSLKRKLCFEDNSAENVGAQVFPFLPYLKQLVLRDWQTHRNSRDPLHFSWTSQAALLCSEEPNVLEVKKWIESGENRTKEESFSEYIHPRPIEEEESILQERRFAQMYSVLQACVARQDYQQIMTLSLLYDLDKNGRFEYSNKWYSPRGKETFFVSKNQVPVGEEIMTVTTCILNSVAPTEDGSKVQELCQSLFKTLLYTKSSSGYQFTIIGTSDNTADIRDLKLLDETIFNSISQTFSLLYFKKQLENPKHFLVELKSLVSTKNISLVKKELELLPLCLANQTDAENLIKVDQAEQLFHFISACRERCHTTTNFEFSDKLTSKHVFGKVILKSLQESKKLGEVTDLSPGDNSVVMTVLSPQKARIKLWLVDNVITFTASIVDTEPEMCLKDDCSKKSSCCDCSSVIQFLLEMISTCSVGVQYQYHVVSEWCQANASRPVPGGTLTDPDERHGKTSLAAPEENAKSNGDKENSQKDMKRGLPANSTVEDLTAQLPGNMHHEEALKQSCSPSGDPFIPSSLHPASLQGSKSAISRSIDDPGRRNSELLRDAFTQTKSLSRVEDDSTYGAKGGRNPQMMDFTSQTGMTEACNECDGNKNLSEHLKPMCSSLLDPKVSIDYAFPKRYAKRNDVRQSETRVEGMKGRQGEMPISPKNTSEKSTWRQPLELDILASKSSNGNTLEDELEQQIEYGRILFEITRNSKNRQISQLQEEIEKRITEKEARVERSTNTESDRVRKEHSCRSSRSSHTKHASLKCGNPPPTETKYKKNDEKAQATNEEATLQNKMGNTFLSQEADGRYNEEKDSENHASSSFNAKVPRSGEGATECGSGDELATVDVTRDPRDADKDEMDAPNEAMSSSSVGDSRAVITSSVTNNKDVTQVSLGDQKHSHVASSREALVGSEENNDIDECRAFAVRQASGSEETRENSLATIDSPAFDETVDSVPKNSKECTTNSKNVNTKELRDLEDRSGESTDGPVVSSAEGEDPELSSRDVLSDAASQEQVDSFDAQLGNTEATPLHGTDCEDGIDVVDGPTAQPSCSQETYDHMSKPKKSPTDAMTLECDRTLDDTELDTPLVDGNAPPQRMRTKGVSATSKNAPVGSGPMQFQEKEKVSNDDWLNQDPAQQGNQTRDVTVERNVAIDEIDSTIHNDLQTMGTNGASATCTTDNKQDGNSTDASLDEYPQQQQQQQQQQEHHTKDAIGGCGEIISDAPQRAAVNVSPQNLCADSSDGPTSSWETEEISIIRDGDSQKRGDFQEFAEDSWSVQGARPKKTTRSLPQLSSQPTTRYGVKPDFLARHAADSSWTSLKPDSEICTRRKCGDDDTRGSFDSGNEADVESHENWLYDIEKRALVGLSRPPVKQTSHQDEGATRDEKEVNSSASNGGIIREQPVGCQQPENIPSGTDPLPHPQGERYGKPVGSKMALSLQASGRKPTSQVSSIREYFYSKEAQAILKASAECNHGNSPAQTSPRNFQEISEENLPRNSEKSSPERCPDGNAFLSESILSSFTQQTSLRSMPVMPPSEFLYGQALHFYDTDNASQSTDSAVGLSDESFCSLEMKISQACALAGKVLREREERAHAARRVEQEREARMRAEARARREREEREERERERKEQEKKRKSDESSRKADAPSKAPVQESPHGLCEHYQRRCKVRFPCCGVFYPCHRCHNGSGKCSNEVKALQATHLQCVVCKNQQEIKEDSQTCNSCSTKFSEYFCPLCKHFTGIEKTPYHCEKCGICRIHKDKSFHCSVCNVCLDKRLEGKHKCRPDSGHDECCICLEDAFSGCQILPCSHKVHRDCALAMLKNGVRKCPVCRHPLYSSPGN